MMLTKGFSPTRCKTTSEVNRTVGVEAIVLEREAGKTGRGREEVGFRGLRSYRFQARLWPAFVLFSEGLLITNRLKIFSSIWRHGDTRDSGDVGLLIDK